MNAHMHASFKFSRSVFCDFLSIDRWLATYSYEAVIEIFDFIYEETLIFQGFEKGFLVHVNIGKPVNFFYLIYWEHFQKPLNVISSSHIDSLS